MQADQAFIAFLNSGSWTTSVLMTSFIVSTLGVVTVVSGPFGAAAVHAARPAQQQIRTPRPVRMRMLLPFPSATGPGGPRGPGVRLGLRRPQQRRKLAQLLGVGGAVLLDRVVERLLVGGDELLLVAGLDGEVDPGQVA